MSSTQISDGPYRVFLSHYGEDVKETFASHLHSSLEKLHFRVFLDKVAMQAGEYSRCQIEGAIATAYVHVVIFSPNFASSSWCLDELVQMLESGAPIIPVFYHVKPSQLRCTRGTEGWFAQVIKNIPWLPKIIRWLTKIIPWLDQEGIYDSALRDLKREETHDAQTNRKKLLYEPDTIEKWRSALWRAANIDGLELEAFDGEEAVLLEKIKQQVVKFAVREAPFVQPTYCIGLNNWLDEFKRTISQEQQLQGRAKVVAILGLGGIGKSTVAKEFFHRNKSDYDRCSFLFDVRKYPLIDLQEKLVEDLISLDLNIENINDGREKLSHYLQDCKVLIVLDDVDKVEQLDALLLPVKTVLHPESLIILIIRNKNILDARLEEPSIYEMRGLNAEQSKELFCWHAFHHRRPDAGFEEIVGTFLKYCTGLTLSVKVLGGLLHGNDFCYWERQHRKISDVFPRSIHRWTLLHIAFLFCGEKSIKLLEGPGSEGSLVFGNLEKICSIDRQRLTMHDHSRDLDRYLASTRTQAHQMQ